VIPPTRHRRRPRAYDRAKYRLRNVPERFRGRIKQFRRVATRYEKAARRFLAFVQRASVMFVLRTRHTVHTA